MSRSLAPNSVAGISLALGLCAAAWFSAGTRPDSIKGVLVLGASYLAWRVSRSLVGRAADGWAGQAWAGADLLAEMCDAVSEFAVYTGLAVAGYAAHWGNTWIVAIAVVIMVAVRRTIAACRGAGNGAASTPTAASVQAEAVAPGDAKKARGAGYLLGRALWGLLTISPGWRLAVIAVAVPVWGAHATLLVLLGWGIIATGFAIAGPGPRPAAAVGLSDPVGAAEPRAGVDQSDLAIPPDLTAPSDLAAPPAQVGSPALASPAGGAGEAETQLPMARSAEPAMTELTMTEPASTEPASTEPTMTLDQMIHVDRARKREPKPRPAVDPPVLAAIAACRDDGATAVWLGQLVRGQFVPLPPAIAGLAATCFLAVLGLRNLPGILLLTPLVVMLLAAPGNGHPHNGRLDWLVPAVLLTGQFIYVAALGFSFRIPAAVTFVLCTMIALRYLDLATRDPEQGQIPDTRLGWEGRMLAVGLGAMFGIGMVAYLAMTAYLGVLICGDIMVSCLDARGRM